LNLQINRTQPGLKKYPMHTHRHYEIMHYLNGKGFLRTREKDLAFSPGTVVIVPPGMEHGSVSEDGFENISIGGDFEHLLYAGHPLSLEDNIRREGAILAEMIYENRYRQDAYLFSLCDAYLHFLLQNLKNESKINESVQKIAREISQNALDPSVNVTNILLESGYAEDYIRSCFKKTTGKTPLEFLTEIRIRHACFLMDIYRDQMPLSALAQQCGYLDYAYFSRKFRAETGVSPAAYRRRSS